MTLETYYPEQRQMLSTAIIRRARLLPEDAFDAEVEMAMGARVGVRDVVARGSTPAPFLVIDAAAHFGLRRHDQLPGLMTAGLGDYVERGQIIAQKRRRRLTAPVTGRIVQVENGTIILQQLSDAIDLEAGLNGSVIEVRSPRGVVIETMGALLQGVWGNNKRAIGVLRFEPEGGVENMDAESLDLEYRGAIVILRQSLTLPAIRAIAEQKLAGLVVPSIEVRLIDAALHAEGAILLTEGFGGMRMNPQISTFLELMAGRQGMIDARTPDADGRPELFINVPLANERPSAPLTSLSLQIGMQVRVVRADMPSGYGQVISIPGEPVMLENGLVCPCAHVEMVTGERVFVPLGNLEIAGR
ncbi:MAG: hypothetical protein KME04_19870 [Pleurocapsa minor GSE-CHR-MK-17-07R]|jgi:hypothetical protein|nr:hypothetical protein [Pleurocapsa minor GSE-CHR-MK 17-07R]